MKEYFMMMVLVLILGVRDLMVNSPEQKAKRASKKSSFVKRQAKQIVSFIYFKIDSVTDVVKEVYVRSAYSVEERMEQSIKLVNAWKQAIYSDEKINFDSLCSAKKLIESYTFLYKNGETEVFKGIECLAFYAASSERKQYELLMNNKFYKKIKERVIDMNNSEMEDIKDFKIGQRDMTFEETEALNLDEIVIENNMELSAKERDQLGMEMLSDKYQYYWDGSTETAVRIDPDEIEFNFGTSANRRPIRTVSVRRKDIVKGHPLWGLDEDDNMTDAEYIEAVEDHINKPGRVVTIESETGEMEPRYVKECGTYYKDRHRDLDEIEYNAKTRRLMSF